MSRIDGKAQDGGGGINELAIDKEGRADTRAVTEGDMAHAIDNGIGYSLHSTYSLTGAQEAISLRNDGGDIHVERIVVSTSASGVVSVMRMTSGTPAGTDISALARNLKLGAPVMADITAFGNASVTGSVDGDVLDAQDIPTATPYTFELSGLLIPLKEVVFVRFATTGVIYVTMYIHREL